MPLSRSALPVARGARFSFFLILAGILSTSIAAAKGRKSPTPNPEQGLKNIPLTVGHEAKGLVLPNYDLRGKLIGRFEAATASRVDEDHVHFSQLKMVTYDEKEKPDLSVNMSDAILNLETRVIDSKERTTIKRTDFEIAGDTMRFNTATRQGNLSGHIHMTIYNQAQLGGAKK